MDTFALFIITVLAWFALEFWRVLRGKPSISEQVWDLYARWPALGMLSGLVVGILLGHFFFRA
jgi:hypothetical protein